jgi:hypothetical protein
MMISNIVKLSTTQIHHGHCVETPLFSDKVPVNETLVVDVKCELELLELEVLEVLEVAVVCVAKE